MELSGNRVKLLLAAWVLVVIGVVSVLIANRRQNNSNGLPLSWDTFEYLDDIGSCLHDGDYDLVCTHDGFIYSYIDGKMYRSKISND